MKAILIAAAMALAACGGEEEENALHAKARAVSRVLGEEIVCEGPAIRSDEPLTGPPFTATICGWDCLRVGDRDARYFYVYYSRESASEPWSGPSISIEYSRIDECDSIRK
jgi:hypothetical protein